ncbi:60S ribosomal protein L28-B [Gilbertella persicaria]|uniref:60S ribosomal protein L28-B n=1 Tax=Gilbertella persicaria TaxID=101096 RepID=UPI002220DCCC|nr:60S ribosomal protein L28-B [Gilbertella persicaria]XP_051432861.1 60S ribosomal protein L28-B [Gilbertella persicaria]XP_051437070.1 60S ribosomal protein L28-B [Gilbertella persicaria]KAI8062764.1 60S ribosomal protein L28-B [Gilbertella persicaria]KAI8070644.1 60S ribosomal protein L28-B [Gilbertella persicaria]KAI8086949.1 60S ribosomal protein L28-B [Gilbertella persicaria]
MDKYHPGYFGKVGMRHFHLKKNPNWRPVVNLDKIWTLAGEGVREKYKNTEKVPVIDALQNGYAKVLAKGTISQPVIVRTRFVSSLAEKKIKAAGGVVELIA